MLRQVIVLALIGGALSYSINGANLEETRDRPGIPDIKYFDCSTTRMQHNKHPWDCTRFIQCDASGRAFDMPCPTCNDPALCPGGGYLHFDGVLIDGKEPSCIWPVNSTCQNVVSTTPEATTTTQATTTTKATTTTQATTTTKVTTQATTTTQPPTVPGGPCNPSKCDILVDCTGWLLCDRIDKTGNPDLIDEGVWERVECDRGLWAIGIPADNSGRKYVVGACVPWKQLPEGKKEECGLKPCLLISGGRCQRNYQYRNDEGDVSAIQSCPIGLVVDIPLRGCVDKTIASTCPA